MLSGAPVAEEAERTFERALEWHRSGRRAEAEAAYTRLFDADPSQHRVAYLLSVLSLEAGRREQAAELLEKAVELAPDQPAYLANLGEVYRRLGRRNDARDALARAAALNPDLALPWFNLGIVLEELADPTALQALEHAADLEPGRVEFQLRLARALAAGGESERALGHYHAVLALAQSPELYREVADVLRGLERDAAAEGMVARAEGRLPEAPRPAQNRERMNRRVRDAAELSDKARDLIAANDWGAAERLLEQAVEHCPRDPFHRLTLGEAQGLLGKSREAAASFRAALELESRLTEARANLGLVAAKLGDHTEALSCFEAATDQRPESFEFQTMLGLSLSGLPRAIGHLHAALALGHRKSGVLVTLAATLRMLGRAHSAVATSRRAVELEPRSAHAHSELGAALTQFGAWEDGLAAHREAAALEPENGAVQRELGNSLMDAGIVDEAIRAYRRAVELAFADVYAGNSLAYALNFDPAASAADILAAGRAWSAQHGSVLVQRQRPHEYARDPERRLRVGYVAPTFWNHVMSLSTLPLVREHDRSSFEVFCYSSAKRPDDVTRMFEQTADVFRDVRDLDDIALAEQIRNDRIDVLVDLNMHMANPRLSTFACRPAPIQVAHGAYPGTTGLDAMDYRTTDPYLDPPDVVQSAAWHERYSEQPMVLPHSFWCYDPRDTEPSVSELPALSGASFRFGCLNGFWKLSEPTLALWARVLTSVAGSRLVLLAPGAHDSGVAEPKETLPARRVLKLLADAGVAEERVEFVPRCARTEYLAFYRSIDLGLDTLPYNGHMTSLDSFWMGVPVVTLVGDRIAGRAGLCLANNLGLEELVAHTADDFVAVATSLARDLPRLSALRSGLRARMTSSPMMNATQYTRDFEAELRKAFRRWCAA